jgi:hypothetical protein
MTDAVTYDDLVTAATVGLSHSPLQVTALAGVAAEHAAVLDSADQAGALLDAAALLTAARRAGVLPVAGITPLPAAAADAAAELPAGAARLLRGGSPELLADLLAEAASGGYRAPAPLLPALLDAAAKDSSLRPAVAAMLGARGRWLAQHRPDWQRVADEGAPDATARGAAAGPGAPDVSGDPEAWETGSRGERRACLAALRDRDPAAARDLLAAGWGGETGNDREDFLTVLARGLSHADEEFLEHALDDRKESVRVAARRLLARLPDSAFSRRAAERAAPLLRLEHRGKAQHLVATQPDHADPAAIRDGITVHSPARVIGTGPWLLTQMIAAAPLASWVTGLGLEPGRLASLPIAGGLRLEVHAGWRLAAISEASAEWADALLAATEPGQAGERPQQAWPREFELAAVLPAAVRAARAAAIVAEATATPHVAAEIAACPRPWPEFLADAVAGALRRIVASAARSESLAYRYGSPVELASAAGHGVPVTAGTDYAAVLAQLASTENCPQYWSSALRRAADTIAVRRAFHEEIR